MQTRTSLRSRLTLHPLFLDLGLTSFVEFSVLIAGLLAVSLIGRLLGSNLLAEYLLLRRVYSFVQSGMLLGAGGALARHVAHAVEKPASEPAGYFIAAAASGGIVVLFLVILFNLASGWFAHVFFGSGQMSGLIFPLTLLMLGGAANDLVYAYYRGCLAMKNANALEFCNAVLLPIVIVMLLANYHSISLIIMVTGLSMLSCSLLFAIPVIRRTLPNRPSHSILDYAGQLLRYGVPRIPSGFALSAMFAFGPMLAAHHLPISKISPLLLGGTMLMGVSSSAQPLGLLLLSKASMVLAQDRLADIRDHFVHLQTAVIELYTFACLQLLVFTDVLVQAWVGSTSEEGLLVIRVVLLATPFFLLFVSQRSIIDAAAVTPHNMFNIAVAFAVFLLLITVTIKSLPLHFLLQSIAWALVIALVILAWLTARTVRRLYGVVIQWNQSIFPVTLALLLGASSLLLHWANGFKTTIGQFVLIEVPTTVVFLFLLRRYSSPWIPFFLRLAFPNLHGKES